MQDVRSADQLLASREWRLRHSLWLLPSVLCCGYLSFVGFVYVAVRTRTAPFIRAAVIATIASVVTWVAASIGSHPSTKPSPDSSSASEIDGWAMAIICSVWLGLLVYGILLNRHYLRWRAADAVRAPWYAQPQPVAATPAPPAPTDKVAELRGRLDTLAAEVHHGPYLPADVHQHVQALFADLRTVLARGQALSTNPENLHVVDRIITDYLPTSLNAYVALPSAYATTARLASGRTPHEELLHQIELLSGQLDEIAEATFAGDAARLQAQGRFLEERFRRSDLDLP